VALAPLDEPPFDPQEDVTHALTPDRAAEQAVLGAMLLDPERAIPAVTETLRGADYAAPDHETLHNVLVELHSTGQPIDGVTIAEHLAARPSTTVRGKTLLEQLGGAPWLHTLMAACPITANADHYAEIVRTAARRRTIEGVSTRLKDVARRGDASSLDTAFQQAYDALDTAAADFGPAATPPTTWSPVNLEPVLAGDYLDPPPTMLRRTDGIPLLYDGGVHTVSGESESGKTWLCLLAALQLLEHDQRVLFVDFEDRADRVIARLLALGATPTQIRGGFNYIRPDRPLDDTGRQQLTPALTDVRLVILDGVTEAMTLHGYDLNANQDSALFQALLPRWIADHGPAVVMIDHVVKDKEKQDRHAIGAQHKLAGIDGAAYMVKTIQPFARGKRGVAQVVVAKDRPGYVREQAFGKVIAEFALDGTFNDVTVIAELSPPGRVSGKDHEGTPWAPTHIMEKASAYVAANPGLSTNAILGVLNGKTDHKRLALELLVTRGYIATKAGPRGATQHFHNRAFYESDNTTQPSPHMTGDTDSDDPDQDHS
jgi:hypothetical protein